MKTFEEMSELEQVELAAKAAGKVVVDRDDDGTLYVQCQEDVRGTRWNPRDDDGDSFRLMVRLKLFPRLDVMGAFVGFEGYGVEVWEKFKDEPAAAARAVVFRAAVEIGRAMP